MIQRKDKGPEILKKAVLVVECPKCGCPNKPGSNNCMYCSTPLPNSLKDASQSLLGKFRRFFRSGPRSSIRRSTILNATYPAIISLFFIPVSVVFLVNALKHGGILNWAVASILALYGGTALKKSWLVLVQKEQKKN
jgi:hypothetical protein